MALPQDYSAREPKFLDEAFQAPVETEDERNGFARPRRYQFPARFGRSIKSCAFSSDLCRLNVSVPCDGGKSIKLLM